jgi:DNA adenine methylase
MMEITSPPVRYTGSKWRIAPWVISHFPKHVCYVEPFCGAAGVFFQKPRSTVECINDLNGEVTNFFKVLRDNMTELIRLIEYTPYSRHELQSALARCDDPLERARRFIVRSRQSFTSGEAEKSRGWRFEINRDSCIDEWNKVSHLYVAAKRLKSVFIEHDAALSVINRFDDSDTLFYCDPPYVSETRTAIDYPLEMTDKDHETLADCLHSIKGMALISGYDSPLYQRLYADWKMVTMEARTVNNVKRTECLWISPTAQSRQSQKRLF